MARSKNVVSTKNSKTGANSFSTTESSNENTAANNNKSIDQEAAPSTSNTAPAVIKDPNSKSCWVWNHFKKHDSIPGKAICKHCRKLITIYITTLKYHLNVKHTGLISHDLLLPMPVFTKMLRIDPMF